MTKLFLGLSIAFTVLVPLYAWQKTRDITITAIFALAALGAAIYGYVQVAKENTVTLDHMLKKHQWNKH